MTVMVGKKSSQCVDVQHTSMTKSKSGICHLAGCCSETQCAIKKGQKGFVLFDLPDCLWVKKMSSKWNKYRKLFTLLIKKGINNCPWKSHHDFVWRTQTQYITKEWLSIHVSCIHFYAIEFSPTLFWSRLCRDTDSDRMRGGRMCLPSLKDERKSISKWILNIKRESSSALSHKNGFSASHFWQYHSLLLFPAASFWFLPHSQSQFFVCLFVFIWAKWLKMMFGTLRKQLCFFLILLYFELFEGC